MDWFKKPNQGPKPQKKRETPHGLWLKCEQCDAILNRLELERNLGVCSNPKCRYHFKIGHKEYIQLLLDPDSFEECDATLVSGDPLQFREKQRYPEYLKQYQERTGLLEAAVSGTGRVGNRPVCLALLDGAFLAGSMGSVVGEKVARSIQRSIKTHWPLIIVSTSGGARMQEGILSLMQMAKTSLWLTRLAEARVPYISILTNPTMAGVMASFASLGDITIAEPGAMMGFAGPRVIQQALGTELPSGFQTSEFFLEHGFVDQVIPRYELRAALMKILGFFPERE
ncbi:MAG: acetyl-CoA carboxylase carboxyltransferase subunit beta [Candidatus Latescibacteria bacterium]|nr:acetyl-CoA carboxylase carboxyltransferase subunit beta [Candidatus Latescibacterota bacterium]